MQLNESTMTELGTFPGGGILLLTIAVSGTAGTTGVFIQGRNTPSGPWLTVTDAKSDFTNLHGLLGYNISDESDDLMRLQPGTSGYVYLDCSRFTSVRVLATGYSGSDATCVAGLPSGFNPDLTASLISPSGAGLVGIMPIAELPGQTDVQGGIAAAAALVAGAKTLAEEAKADAEAVLGVATTANQNAVSAQGTADGAAADVAALATEMDGKVNAANAIFTGPVVGITKEHVGLSSVDNTSDAAKPVSNAQQTALNLKANLESPTFTGTVGGITKAMVGLGSVDNTSDAGKPVSTAQQTALNAKQSSSSKDASGGYVGLTLYKVNMRNAANTATSYLTNLNTVSRTYTLPDKDGTVAMLSDIPTGSGGVPLDQIHAIMLSF